MPCVLEKTVSLIYWINGKKSEAVVRRCSANVVFLKILQNSRENNKVAGDLWHRCFYRTALVAASEKYDYLVNARFTQRLLQLIFTFFVQKTSK